MVRISIVVPAYNAEKYIGRCLDSLCGQTLQNIEIICVNDGSSDATEQVIRRYMEKDSRIQLVNKPNGGLALARRDGIARASSEYIGFLDSDDTFEPSFCEKMVNAMDRYGCDVAECGYYDCAPNGTKTPDCFFSEDRVLDQADFVAEVFAKTVVDGTEAVVVWNKVYRAAKITELVKTYGHSPLEDYVFNSQYYTGVQRYVFLHECLMNYQLTANSLSHKFDRNRYRVLMDAEAVKQEAMAKLGKKESWDASAASWFCRYVERFLLAGAVVFRDQAFFASVIQEDYLITQARKVQKKDVLTWAIARRSPVLTRCIFSLATAALVLKRWAAAKLGR